MDARAYYLQAAEAAATVTTPAAVARSTAGGEVAARASSYFQAPPPPPPPPPRHGQSLATSWWDGVDLRYLICPECGKVFQSDKAMYGHLRSHPAKGYKGATRPTPNPAGGPVAGAGGANKPRRKVARRRKDRQAAPAGLSIRWPVRAKRGRLPLAPAGAASSSSSVSTAVLESSFSFGSEEEQAAMILLQLSGFRGGGTGEPPEEELLPVQQMPVAVAESQIVPQADQLEPVPADHVLDVAVLDASEPEVEQLMIPDHVSAGAGASLPMMPGHVSGGAALWQADKSAPPVAMEHMFGVITESSSLAASIEQAKVDASSSEARGKKLGKLVVSDAKKPVKKRRLLHDLEPQAAHHSSRPAEAADALMRARRIPSPASNRSFVCPRCDKKFPTHQALGGHMASHNRASNKYGTDGQQQQHRQLVAQLAVQSLMASQGGAIPRANAAAAIACGNTTGTNAAVASANTATAGTSSGELRGIVLPTPPTAPILLAPPAVYPCSRCELIFPTGQALGGHKRRHWLQDKVRAEAAATRAAIVAAAAEAIAAATTAVEAGAAGVAASAPAPAAPRGEPRDFDLNEMPSEE